jgi:hypothetical protein
MGKILHGPWTEQGMERPVSSCLAEESYESLALPIVKAKQELQRVGGPFVSSGDVLPVHCKNALNILCELKENVSLVSQSLHQADSFETILAPSRYPLLTILYKIEELASKLIDQLNTYLFTCLESSQRVRRQHHIIVSQLEDISQQLADIPELVKSLDEDVESQGSYWY